jgi:hypothetical protein
MKIEITDVNGIKIAETISDEVFIKEPQDALDIMAECSYLGSGKIIFHEKNLVSDFFDLKTGLAGEILQKFSNYNVQLAIVGDFMKYTSRSLKSFMLESNKHGRINFVHSKDEALERLSR